jgi:hypothetical protein
MLNYDGFDALTPGSGDKWCALNREKKENAQQGHQTLPGVGGSRLDSPGDRYLSGRLGPASFLSSSVSM